MLHSESWKNSPQGHIALTLFFGLLVLGTLNACFWHRVSPEEEALYNKRQQLLSDSLPAAQQWLQAFAASHRDSVQTDKKVNQYYKDNGHWFWLSEDTAFMAKADEITDFLEKQAHEMGFSAQAFHIDDIRTNIRMLRQMDFDSTHVSAVETMALLEWQLSRAFLRYAQGQRYGFTNPHRMLNKLDPRKEGGYRIIYDIDLEKADDNFLTTALGHAGDKHPADYLKKAETDHPVYAQLKRELANDSTGTNRQRILCNMERLRWRHVQQINPNEKHIFVNIAAQQLWAICPDSVLSMRICCGAWKTKTPLLESNISYIQFNPEWNIPASILRDEVSAHAGDSAYFARNDYFIVNRNTGDTISPKLITSSQLKSGAYRVAQRSGKHNSLGRIIFRFKNQFDVYLHDTNNHNAFNADRRTISHGCVRVQRPFNLLLFVLNDPDEWMLDKIRLSIDMKPETERGIKYLKEHNEEHSEEPIRLTQLAYVKPNIPLSIDYYTYYPNPETGEFETWPDRYEYDNQIIKAIKPFLPINVHQ